MVAEREATDGFAAAVKPMAALPEPPDGAAIVSQGALLTANHMQFTGATMPKPPEAPVETTVAPGEEIDVAQAARPAGWLIVKVWPPIVSVALRGLGRGFPEAE